MIIAALQQHLAGVSAITDLVEDRIYPNYLPQGLDLKAHTPAISFYLLGNQIIYDLAGAQTLATAAVQIDTWGYDAEQVVLLARRIRHELVRFNTQIGFLHVAGGKVIDEQQLNESPTDGSDDWLFRRMQEYQFRYSLHRFSYTAQGGIVIGGDANLSPGA